MSFEVWMYGERRVAERRLSRAPARKIAEVTDGSRAQVAGIVEPIGSMLAGPLSGRPCAYWRIDIEEVGVADFRVCGRDECSAELLVRDASGVARIIPQGAMMALATSTIAWLNDARANEIYLRVKPRVNYASSTIRVRERLIVPAAPIRLAGTATREPDPDASDDASAGYRGELPSRPVFAHSRRAPLAIADGRVTIGA